MSPSITAGPLSAAECILVVEDDVHIQELLQAFLQAHGYKVDVASDGAEGYRLFQSSAYDLVLLDVMMPKLDGYSLCRMIRGRSLDIPIIVVTALGEEKDELQAFEFKADDFVSKPFSFQVLVRRVEAVLRRAKARRDTETVDTSGESSPGVRIGRLRLDAASYRAYVDEQDVELTTTEFEILQVLLSNAGRILTRELLLDRVWGCDYYGDARVVDAHIKNIRRKVALPCIRTVKGVGYAFEAMGEPR